MSVAGHKQRGVAILTAMLVVTLGTIIAVNLMWVSSLDQRRTGAALAADQALLYLQGAEAWVGDILRQDQIESGESDHLGELWATEIAPLPVDGGMITGRIEDLQGRFNINNLITPQGEVVHGGLDQVDPAANLFRLGLEFGAGAVEHQ